MDKEQAVAGPGDAATRARTTSVIGPGHSKAVATEQRLPSRQSFCPLLGHDLLCLSSSSCTCSVSTTTSAHRLDAHQIRLSGQAVGLQSARQDVPDILRCGGYA